MARIAFCLPALRGHVEAHAALAKTLQNRGHEVVFVGTNGLKAYAAQNHIPFLSLNFQEQNIAQAGLLRTLRATAQNTQAWIQCGPEILGDLNPDLTIVDQVEPGAALASEAANIRMITLAAALPMDRDEAIPPPFVPWPYLEGEKGEKRNRGGWRVSDFLMRWQSKALKNGCAQYGLRERVHMDEWISEICDLRQFTPSLDFPHQAPPSAEAVGPLRLHDFVRSAAPKDKPIVFASLGSLQGGRKRLMHAIARATAGLDVEVYLAHCGGLSDDEAARLPGHAHIKDFHPQLDILKKADACITHAGMNTALDCAALGVPMVAIPLAFEQPANAARLNYHKVAEVIPPRKANASRIRDALEKVLTQPNYRDALAPVREEIAKAGGVKRAADLVESHLPQRAKAAKAESLAP